MLKGRGTTVVSIGMRAVSRADDHSCCVVGLGGARDSPPSVRSWTFSKYLLNVSVWYIQERV